MGVFGFGSSGRGGFEFGSTAPELGIEDQLWLSWLEEQFFSMDEIGGDAPRSDYSVNSQIFQFGGPENKSMDRFVGEEVPMILNQGLHSFRDSIDQLPDCEFQVDTITPEDFFVPDLQPPAGDDSIHMEVDLTLQSATNFVSVLPSLVGDEDYHTQTIDTTDLEEAMEKLTLEDDEMEEFDPVRRWPVLDPCKSIGVTQRKNGTWEAHIWLKDYNIDRPRNGMQFFVGSFGSKEDAKKAHDMAAIKLDVSAKKDGTPYSLNYPEEQYEDYMTEHAQWSRRDYLWKMRRDSEKFSTGACGLKGVRLLKNRKGEVTGRYIATTSVTSKISNSTESSESSKNSPISKLKAKKKFLALGSFSSEEEAGRAYDKAILFIQGMYSGCVTNFQPGSYSETEILEVGRKLTQAYPKVDFEGAHKTTLECLLHEYD